MIYAAFPTAEAWAQVRVAQGRAPADLLVRNCRLVNVYSGEIHDADVAIKDGMIVATRAGFAGEAQKVMDVGGRHIVPGLVASFEAASPVSPSLATSFLEGVTSVVEDTTRAPAASGPDQPLRQWSAARVGVPKVLGQESAAVASGEQVRQLLRSGLMAFPVTGASGLAEILATLKSHGIDRARVCLGRLPSTAEAFSGGFLSAAAAVRAGLAAGISPAEAVALATLHPAIAYGLDHRVGSVSPGRCADFLLLDDLPSFSIAACFLAGAEKGHS